MLPQVTINSTKRLLKNPFITVEEVSYTQGDIQRKWICSPKHDSVHVLVYNSDTDQLLLVEQIRIPALRNGNPTTIEACAGIIDSFEGFPDRARMTAAAEVAEELGYQVSLSDLTPLPSFIGSTGGSGSICYPFFVTVTNDQYIGQSLGDGEYIDVHPVPSHMISTFLGSVTNTDATTRYLLYYFLLNRN